VSGAKQPLKHRWTFSLRYLSDQIDRAELRTTLTYRLTRTFQLGVEYNPLADEVAPLANWLVLPETAKRPALMLGTSTDRIGTPHGQSFYATLSKGLKRETRLPIAPYVGVMYGTYEDRFRPVGGLSVYFTENFSTLTTFDGVHGHQLVNYTWKRHVISLVLVRFRSPGFSYSIAF